MHGIAEVVFQYLKFHANYTEFGNAFKFCIISQSYAVAACNSLGRVVAHNIDDSDVENCSANVAE